MEIRVREDTKKEEAVRVMPCWRGPGPKECRQPLEVGKDEAMDSPLKPLQERQPYQHLDFSPIRPISNF